MDWETLLEIFRELPDEKLRKLLDHEVTGDAGRGQGSLNGDDLREVARAVLAERNSA